MTALTWVGITLCIAQAGIFSGLNLAFFAVSKLRLEVSADQGDKKALLISRMRRDANFLLSSILWGNVAVNVLLTLLSNSVLAGVGAFLFSTVIITLLGEIIPQAFFSRHAINAAYYLSPLVKVYQILLFPVAKPTSMVLNAILGHESIRFFRERELRKVISMHMDSESGDIELVEGLGALNFFALDDLPVAEEGETIDPESVVSLPFEGSLPVFPEIGSDPENPFLAKVSKSRKKWIIIVDDKDSPRFALKSDSFLREALYGEGQFRPLRYCHRPLVVGDATTPIGEVIPLLTVHPEHGEDDVVDNDVIVVWTDDIRRIITGSDVLGRLLRGIVKKRRDA